MRDALYGVLPRRVVLVAVPMLAACALGTPLASAVTRPVRATSAKVVRRAVAQPAPLALATLERDLGQVAGHPVRISCDTAGVPSPLDGNTLDTSDAEGQVFYEPQATLDDGTLAPLVIGDVLHVLASTCQAAVRANRVHDRDPVSWVVFRDRRIDEVAGHALRILLHEAFHVALQSSDEGIVECSAVSNAWPLVKLLGLAPFDAGLILGGMQWSHYQFTPDVPAEAPYRAVC